MAPLDSGSVKRKLITPEVITPKVLLTRDNELVKTIVTSANEVTINIYDNGTIDHDTVSVYLDKKTGTVQENAHLQTAYAYVLSWMIAPIITNCVVAENLGDIPLTLH